MNEITRVAIDTSKSVFTLHAVDARDQPVLRRNLRRQDLVPFFAKLPPVTVSMEACGGSHYWGRTLQALGHQVRLIPAQYVKPFVKRSKNDRNDAQAISEAAARPGMQEVAVKSADVQARAMLLTVRELLVRQRTQLVNALRGHATEMGLVAPVGGKGLAMLRSRSRPTPQCRRRQLKLCGCSAGRLISWKQGWRRWTESAGATQGRSRQPPSVSHSRGRADERTRFSRMVDATQLESGRHFAAWLGLVPREVSTGGKQRLGGISRAGNERLRQLLVLGATAVIRFARPGRPGVSAWLLALLERKPRKLAAVALANKMARIIWAMLTRGEEYRLAKPVVA